MTRGKTIAVILTAIVGCGVIMLGLCGGLLYLGYRTADKAVSPQVDAMFAAMDDGSFADTYETHTTDELRSVASKEQYDALGKAIALRLGEFKKKTLHSFQMRRQNGGSYIDVRYSAEFEKGNGTIDARLKKEQGDWKFVAFHVNSPVFSQDLATVECSACGKPRSADARFCPSCGTAVVEAAESEPAVGQGAEAD